MKSGENLLRRIRLAGLLLSAATLFLVYSHLVVAQSQSEWSVPQLIYQTSESIDVPYLIADANGVTHLVWREFSRSGDSDGAALEAIYYATDSGGNWSQGLDVIAMGSASGPTAAVDSNGLLHLLWQGPGMTLFHSLARVDAARTAHGWVEPLALVTSNGNAHILFDGAHAIHIAYPGTSSSGVFYLRYDLATGIWSAPTAISPTAANNTSANYTRLAIGPDGTLHVVWSEFQLPDGWPPTGVYYSSSDNSGASWSGRIELVGDGYNQSAVIADSEGVHVVWNGMVGIGGRYHRWSNDGGQTWSPTEAVVPPGNGGTEGPPQLQIDSSGTLHLLTTYNGCAWHARWEEGRWSEPTCISGREAMASNYIEQPALALANGNQLHAVFWDDRARLWHTTLMTGAPPTNQSLPAQMTLPTATIEPTPAPTPTGPATPLPASITTAGPPPSAGMNAGPAWSLLLSTGAAIVLLGFTMLIKTRRSR